MNDSINRQMAIDTLHGYFDGMLETDTICPKDLYNLFEIIPSAEPIDVQEAYNRGKIDGIKECMTRLKKVNEEFANG